MMPGHTIPLVDLKRQTRQLEREIQHAIAEVLADCHFVRGKWIEEFEEAFAGYCGASHASAVSSGTAALQLALLAAGVALASVTVAAAGYRLELACRVPPDESDQNGETGSG